MCPDEGTLIRLLGGELPQGQAEHLAAHLRQCADCGCRHAALKATWEALGRWQVTPPAADLRAGILQEAARRRAAEPRPGRRFWLRVAASVVLAAGAGMMAAMSVTRGDRPFTASAASGEEVARVLGLEALGGGETLGALFGQDEQAGVQGVEEERL
jgi:anti-sigma factor RsiW